MTRKSSSEDEPEELLKQFAELKKENEMFKMILEALPAVLYVKDKDCKYQITSRFCDFANGAERGTLKGKTDFDLQDSEDMAQAFYDDDQKIMHSKQGGHRLLPALRGDDIKCYDIYKEPLINQNNEVAGILGMVIDSGIKTNGSNLSAEISHSSDSLIFDYDLETGRIIVLKKLIELNELCDIKGNFETKMLESERIAADDRGVFLKQFQKIKAGETQSIAIFKILDDRKRWTYCTLSLSAVYNHGQNSPRVIGTLTLLNKKNKDAVEFELSVDAAKKQLNNIIQNRFETILYINFNLGWYQTLGNSIPALEKTGTTKILRSFCSENMYAGDVEEILRYFASFHDSSSGNGNIGTKTGDAHKAFEKRIKINKSYRWNEIQVFPVPALDERKMDCVIIISDVDDAVRVKKQLEIRQSNNQIIEVLSSVVESRDIESGNHIRRIKEVTRELLMTIMDHYPQYGLDKSTIEVIVAASAMHDIGKIAIPDTILLKPGKLTAQEFDLMKEHALKGCDIINNLSTIQDKEYYQYCYDICRHHHERYDGNGYPDGLKEDEISIAAQVVALADIYDALISKRCYKDAYEEGRVFEMIMNGECGIFNPIVLDCLKRARNKLKIFYDEERNLLW